MPAATLQIPEVGQAVRVRNRLATVRAVESYDSPASVAWLRRDMRWCLPPVRPPHPPCREGGLRLRHLFDSGLPRQAPPAYHLGSPTNHRKLPEKGSTMRATGFRLGLSW